MAIRDLVQKAILDGQVKAFMPSHYTIRLMKVSGSMSYDNEFGEGHYDLVSGDAKLEGTRGEHWSPAWKKILKKYLLADGQVIVPEELPEDTWISVQTNPDPAERRKSITWSVDAMLISDGKFEIGGLTIDPAVDMLCMGGDEHAPNLDWGCWPVKKGIFADTYEALH